MNLIDKNMDTQTKIQMTKPDGNDHIKANQGGSETNQRNGDNQRHTREINHNNRGKNKQSIQQQRSKFTGVDESLKVLLSPTERRDKVQLIDFKELIITHVLANFNHPTDIVKFINTGSIPVIPLPTLIKIINKYGFTNVDALNTEEKESLYILLTDKKKECRKIKRKLQQNIVKLCGIVWRQCLHYLQSEAMRDTKYEEISDIYNIVWTMNKMKLLCADVDCHMNKFYAAFHTLKDFYTIRQESGETVTKYFDRFVSAQVNS